MDRLEHGATMRRREFIGGVATTAVLGALIGSFGWPSVLLALLVLSFGNASVSVAALLLRGSTAGGPEGPEEAAAVPLSGRQTLQQTLVGQALP